MKARDIMTANPLVVTRDDKVGRAAEIMRDLDVGFVPVVESTASMRLEGVITDRDIAIRHVADGHGSDCTVESHMSADRIRTVAPDDDLEVVLETMQENQVRRIPVVEPEGRLVGIVAQADIATGDVGERKVGETVERISESSRSRREQR